MPLFRYQSNSKITVNNNILKPLLRHGANIKETDHDGQTSSHYASALGLLEILDLFPALQEVKQDMVNLGFQTG